jgi:dihydroorotate dehydrogenase
MIYSLSRAALFRLDPELAHGLALNAIARVGAVAPMRAVLRKMFTVPGSKPVQAMGLTFPNRIGLAAGYDKDGDGWRGLATFGFGHIEVGTVTPKPQSGNPKPRVFRLVEDRSVINRMGFPGRGADYVVGRLQGPRPEGLILGVNLGKQKDTPLEEAAGDYEELMSRFAELADYLAINISSPNTPGLRRLQERGFLEELLGRVCSRRDDLTETTGRRVPVVIKLAPDLDEDQLEVALEAILGSGIDGIVATNTTLSREGVTSSSLAKEEGGLSGALLTLRATEIVSAIRRKVGEALPIIAVGGVMTPDDARAKIDAGATLVQIYSGLIYEGPGFVGRLVREIG